MPSNIATLAAKPSNKLTRLFTTIDPEISNILQGALANQEVSEIQGLLLFATQGDELEALIENADPADIAAGCDVLFQAMVEQANTP